jgi:hypothetical protein
MRIRTVAPLVAAVVLAAGTPAFAAKAKPKPQTGSVAVTLAPQPASLEACASPGQVEDVNKKTIPIKVTGAGKLEVVLTGFFGDWDMVLLASSGASLAEGAGTNVDGSNSTPVAPLDEKLTYKSKKAQTMNLVVCNFVGSPNATVKYTYTYN